MDGRSVRTGAPQLSREQIMQATMASLTEEGYDATTIRKIAGRLDCAVGSIYRYYKDKQELLSLVTQQVLAPVVIALEAGESFHHSVSHYHRIVSQHPETYRLMFWLACHDPQSPVASGPHGDVGSRVTDTRPTPPIGHFDTSRVPLVVDRIIKGWAKDLDSFDDASYVWSVLHGMVLLGGTVQDVFDAVTPRLMHNITRQHAQETAVQNQTGAEAAEGAAATIVIPPAVTIPPLRAAVLQESTREKREDVTML